MSDLPDYYARIRDSFIETIRASTTGLLAAEDEYILYDAVRVNCELIVCELGTDYNLMELHIRPYNADGTLGYALQLAHYDGSATHAFSPDLVNTHFSDIIRTWVHDEANDHFKIGLRRSVRCSNGVRITVENPDPAAGHNFSIVAVIQQGILV